MVFIVDSRPIGYELKTSIHIVCAIYDDSSIIKVSKDALNINQEKVGISILIYNFLLSIYSSHVLCRLQIQLIF
ncbi:hypothetical protein AHAS_Ahas07G0072300 [Arachis hypogaea]